MTRRQFRFTLAVGILGIVLLLAWFLLSAFLRPAAPMPAYTLRSCNGKLALYPADSDVPLAVYEDVYVRLLPERDQISLRSGVPVEDEARLAALLEDYGH